MTIANCVKALKIYKENGMTKAYENMKQHILKAKKFQGHSLRSELLREEEPKVESEPEPQKEVKDNGKKSKRR